MSWLSNQAYTFFQFTRHDWFGAGIDSAVVAISASAVAAPDVRAGRSRSVYPRSSSTESFGMSLPVRSM